MSGVSLEAPLGTQHMHGTRLLPPLAMFFHVCGEHYLESNARADAMPQFGREIQLLTGPGPAYVRRVPGRGDK